jgi:hypothetical protein
VLEEDSPAKLENSDIFLPMSLEPQFGQLVLSAFRRSSLPRSMLSNWNPQSLHLYSLIGKREPPFSRLLMRDGRIRFRLLCLRAQVPEV